jgi:hypothetical protein
MFCVAGPAKLVEQAKLKSGISPDGASRRPRRTSACSDDYAQWLLAQWATINPELDFEFQFRRLARSATT